MSPHLTRQSPSRMKVSCSHVWEWCAEWPPGSISKYLMAKFSAPSSFVISHRTLIPLKSDSLTSSSFIFVRGTALNPK